MKKTFLIFLAISVVVVGVLLTKNTTLGQNSDKKKSEDNPTSVTIGVMTSKQKKHSKLYEKRGKNLLDEEKEIEVVFSEGYSSSSSPQDSLSDKISGFQKKACDSDVIIIGLVKEKASQITEDQTFIFTDYVLNIGDVIKNGTQRYLETSAQIDLTTSGGAIKVNDRVFKVKFQGNKEIREKQKYLFLLKYLPELDSFQLSDAKSVFSINGNKIIRDGKYSYPFDKKSVEISSAKSFFDETLNNCSQ